MAARAFGDHVRDALHRCPRHVVLGALVLGLLLGGRVPAEGVLVTAIAGVLLLARAALLPGLAVGCAVALLIGAGWGHARTVALQRTALAGLIGTTVDEQATLLAAPRSDARGTWRARVRWRGETALVRMPSWIPDVRRLETGMVVQLHARVRPPDLAARAARAHVTLQAESARPTGARRGGVPGAVDAIRRRAEVTLAAGLPTAEAGLFRGMVLGQDEGLPADLRDAFTAAGLSHLVAASGANVALLAALAFALCAVAGLGIRARWLLVLGLIALYVPLAGAGPSIQRAGVMGAATIAAAMAGRPAMRWYAMGVAAVVTLAFDPRSAADPGWQLSFAAVFGIATLGSRLGAVRALKTVPPGLRDAVAPTIAASLATAPLIAAHFDRTSLVSLPANVLAAPAVAPVMWLGMGAAAVGQLSSAAAWPLVAAASLPLAFLTWLGRTAAVMPHAEVAAPVVVVGAVCGATGAAIIWRGRAAVRRVLVAVAVTAMVGAGLLGAAGRTRLVPPPDRALRVLALDVGQGDATLLQAGGHALLVDAGPPGAPIVARLRESGVRRLDAVLATHGASDHLGGVADVLRSMPVGMVLDGRDGDRSPVPATVDSAARAVGVPLVPIRQDQEVAVGPLRLRILWPPPAEGPFDPTAEANDRAVVALASAYGASALLTADAESNVLARIPLAPVDVLKVSHHGSRDEGLAGILDVLHPRVALVEVGRRNSYGHPAPSTIAALSAVSQVLRTDREGTTGVDLVAGRAWVVGGSG